MSSFVKNLARGGYKTHNKFKGGFINIEFPIPPFLREVILEERKLLFGTGRTMLRQYKRTLGKPKPNKMTPKQRVSTRYKREVVEKQERPPWKITGVLRRGTEFFVDENRGEVIAGPYKIDGMSPYVRSSKPIPQLLEEGGSIVSITRKKSGASRRLKQKRRKFPYKGKAMATGLSYMTKNAEGMIG